MSQKLPAAVVFDWDNTLIDTFPLIFAGNNLVRREFGLAEWSEAECHQYSQLSAKEMFTQYYGDRAAEAEKIFYGHIREHHLTSLKVMAEAENLVLFLIQKGVKLGIVSNKRGEVLRQEVAALNWNHHFLAVLGPDDVGGVGKPDPRGVCQALAQLGLESNDYSNTWYIGDTPNDIKTAKAAGMISVFIENASTQDPKEIAALQPDYSFKSCVECLAYIKTLI